MAQVVALKPSAPIRDRANVWKGFLGFYLLFLGWNLYPWARGAPDLYPHEHLRSVVLSGALVAIAGAGIARPRLLRGVLFAVNVALVLAYVILAYRPNF